MITTMNKMLSACAALALICGVAYADFPKSEQAVNGKKAKVVREPDWEKIEEPAMRPYKAFFRGLAALSYHTVKGLADGNEKFPILGSVEAFRGFRIGAVELTTSTYKGMAGSKVGDYRMVSKPNNVIENDIFLRNAADGVTAGLVLGAAAGSVESGAYAGTGVWLGQKGVDRSPVDPKRMERKEARMSRRKEAQERYIKDRAHINEKTGNSGNLIRKLGD
jgi:hypothetical protein